MSFSTPRPTLLGIAAAAAAVIFDAVYLPGFVDKVAPPAPAGIRTSGTAGTAELERTALLAERRSGTGPPPETLALLWPRHIAAAAAAAAAVVAVGGGRGAYAAAEMLQVDAAAPNVPAAARRVPPPRPPQMAGVYREGGAEPRKPRPSPTPEERKPTVEEELLGERTRTAAVVAVGNAVLDIGADDVL